MTLLRYCIIEPQILEKLPSTELTIHEELRNSSDYFIITLLIKFISSCFDLQNNLLSILFILKDLILFSSFFYCNFLIAFVNFRYKMHAFAIL